MSCTYEYITDARVAELLRWEDVLEAAERALESVSTGDAYQTTRTHLPIGQSFNSVNIMSGYLQDKKYGSLVHLFFNPFRGNRNLDPPLSVVHSEITLVDETTGVSKAVRVWNRTKSKAENLVNELNQGANKSVFVTSSTVEDCVSGADVIVTATHSSQTLVEKSWIKVGAHINAIGVSPVNTELDANTYRTCKIYTDYEEGAEAELNHIKRFGTKFEGQVGDVISGKISVPKESDTTIFQSLGMAVQYCAICRLIYDKHHGQQ